MSTESSANTSLVDDSKIQDPATPSRSSSISGSAQTLKGESHIQGSSKFKLFENTTTPLQRSTNALNQNISTAPPFLRNPNEVSLDASGLVDLNLAIGALDLDFGSTRSAGKQGNISNKKDSATDLGNGEALAKGEDVDGANAGFESHISNENIQHNPEQHYSNGIVHHHQHQFSPFFPINGFGQPLHAGFAPGEHSDSSSQHQLNHQPWPIRPGQISFGNPLTGEADGHTPPIHSGLIPLGPFEFGPENASTPSLPHLQGQAVQQGDFSLQQDANFNQFGVNSSSNLNNTFPRGFNSGVDGISPVPVNFNSQQPLPLQDPQLWPALSGGPQGSFGSIPSNGLGPNNGSNDRRFQYFPNNNNGGHHHNHHQHHYHNNNNGRKYVRKRDVDASRFANAKLEDFIGQIYSLCQDQDGCRFLQKQLDLDPKNATPIFEETHSHVIGLMVDPFGNYLVQKLVEKIDDSQRVILAKTAAPEFVSISLDPHGTRALQKLVETINTEEEAKIIVEALSKDVVSLSRDLNGNHVVQKCLQRLTNEDSQFIFDAAYENCLQIATHRHGCCVLQRCLDHGSPEQCKKLSLVVSEFTDQLSLDAFGNYVVQYVLAKDDDESISKIISVIKENIIKLALHKFGSNVIEKSLRLSKYSPELIDSLLNHESEFVKLLNDPYGNYVLQTSLDVALSDKFNKLSSLLRPLLPQVRNTPHGRRISSRLQQFSS